MATAFCTAWSSAAEVWLPADANGNTKQLWVWELIGISTSFSQCASDLTKTNPRPIPARDFKTACVIFKSIHQSVGSNVKNAQPAQYLFQTVTTLLVPSEQATSNSKALRGKNHNKWVSVPKSLNDDCKDQEKTVLFEQGIMHYKNRCMKKIDLRTDHPSLL